MDKIDIISREADFKKIISSNVVACNPPALKISELIDFPYDTKEKIKQIKIYYSYLNSEGNDFIKQSHFIFEKYSFPRFINNFFGLPIL